MALRGMWRTKRVWHVRQLCGANILLHNKVELRFCASRDIILDGFLFVLQCLLKLQLYHSSNKHERSPLVVMANR
jgi:hypothetical protein